MATISGSKHPRDPDLAEDISSGSEEKKILKISEEEKENLKSSEEEKENLKNSKEKKKFSTMEQLFMKDEELREYVKQVTESEGFVVGKFKGRLFGQIVPTYLPEYKDDNRYDREREELSPFCEEALLTYNKSEDANYEFAGLVRANFQMVAGTMYYLTFKAVAPSDQTGVILEAKVWYKVGNLGTEVMFCRKKATQ